MLCERMYTLAIHHMYTLNQTKFIVAHIIIAHIIIAH
jgi:hypothetical protein